MLALAIIRPGRSEMVGVSRDQANFVVEKPCTVASSRAHPIPPDRCSPNKRRQNAGSSGSTKIAPQVSGILSSRVSAVEIPLTADFNSLTHLLADIGLGRPLDGAGPALADT